MLSSVTLFGMGCATSKKELASPDLSLIREATPEVIADEPFQSPFIDSFEGHGHQLTFVAADGRAGLSSANLRTVREAVQSSRAQVLVLRTLARTEGVTPKWYLDLVEQCARDEFRSCSESEYAAYLARDRGMAFVGAEPPEPGVLMRLQQTGYSPIDVLGFVLVRQIPEWRRENRIDWKHVQGQITSHLNLLSRRFELEKPITYSEFVSWYSKHAPEGVDFLDVTADHVTPEKESSSLFHQLSYHWERVREREIAWAIYERILASDSVLVVYPHAHLAGQRKMWEAVFGKSDPHKLF